MPIECFVFEMKRAIGDKRAASVEKAGFDPHLYPHKLACPRPLA
jgi:hypothetical protein